MQISPAHTLTTFDVLFSGDAGQMAKAVERELVTILGKAKGGSDAEGEKELKLLKDRARLLLDVSGPDDSSFLCSFLLLTDSTCHRLQVWS